MSMSAATDAGYILIVDDDAALLQALPQSLHLRMGGIRIDTADSADKALAAVTATDYDAVISDIKMPGMDGLVLLRKITELRPDTPMLLVTGHGEHDLAIQALRGGAYDFIQKPIERDYLVASLRRAIQARQLRRRVQQQQHALAQHTATLERAVAERTRELVEANQVKDTFLSIASHELRTPLTTLKALVQTTHRRLVATDAPEATQLERMGRAISRMELLVNDLVDASRIDSGKLAFRLDDGDLADLCRQVADEQQAATQRKIVVDLAEEPLPYVGDAERISQVLANLLSNAMKFSPPDAPVTLRVRQEGAEAVLSIHDRGSGIPQEDLPHIFERFYQVSETRVQAGSRIGLGLGLFICHEIVQRHHGSIWAESAPGKGSTFFVALPLAPIGEAAGVRDPKHEADRS
jgi:two-component system sensor histidine kinase/response regulator